MIRLIREINQYDVRPLLSHVNIPILGVWGSRDQVSPLTPWQEAFSKLPKGTFTGIVQAGHAVMIDCPEAFATSIANFLAHLSE